MRMAPTRSSRPGAVAQVKKHVSDIEHIIVPLKGIDISTQKTAGKPLTGPVLDNFVIAEDRCLARPGLFKHATLPGAKPIETIVPYFGVPIDKVMASDNKLYQQDGTVLHAGFTSNDWSWTSFANLGVQDYTLMANGTDGVWSWDGGNTVPGPTVALTKLDKTNPAVCTVAAADISKFSNGMTVFIAGAVGTGMTAANGAHVISSVNVPVNTFTLTGVNCSTGAAAQTTGLTAYSVGSIVKEVITLTASGTAWFNQDRIHIVMTHQNRVWFADRDNLTVYYLPIQSKSGACEQLPLNAYFKKGGTVRALYTWSIDGGAGMEDKLVIFSSHNEAAIFSGTDPDSDYKLEGVYRFDSPMSKHACINYGGELYVLISTGLVPMSTLMRAESEQLGQSDKGVVSAFTPISERYRDRNGWSVLLDHSSGRMICNMPLGAPNRYKQMVRKMPTTFWSSWSGLPSRSWQWLEDKLWIGSDDGVLYEMNPDYLSDAGKPIRVDMQSAWSNFKTPAYKDFKLIRAYITTDGEPRPFLDVKADYDTSPPINQPDASFNPTGAEWDTATWDVDYWAGGLKTRAGWNGVASAGNVGAPRLVAFISNCTFAVSGFDIVYETGSILG